MRHPSVPDAKEIGTSTQFPTPPDVAPDCTVWLEDGTWYYAPTVDPKKFGPHDYAGVNFAHGIRDCKCGCYMLNSASGGPVDPFGACPLNPRPPAPPEDWATRAAQEIVDIAERDDMQVPYRDTIATILRKHAAMDKHGITEEDIAETRFPEHCPENR